MRSYSGYLLIEDLLDTLPSDSASLYRIAQYLINPKPNVVEEDCRTLLGKKVSIGYGSIGMYDLALDRLLTREDIVTLLSQGEYYRKVRSPAFCTSHGGVCRKCAYTVDRSAKVGSPSSLPSHISTGFFSFRGGEGVSTFIVDVSEEEVDLLEVFVDSVPENGFTYDYLEEGRITVTLDIPPMPDAYVDIRAVKNTASPLMSYLSKTYSGSLLGAAKSQGYDLPVRANLLREYMTDSRISILESELEEYQDKIPDGYLDYSSSIRDPLERGLYLIALYGIFNDVEA